MKKKYRDFGEVDFEDHELEEREEQYLKEIEMDNNTITKEDNKQNGKVK